MINFDKILGAVLQSVVSGALSSVLPNGAGRRVAGGSSSLIPGVSSSTLGVGALGVAVAAYEHFMKGTGPGTARAAGTHTATPPLLPPPPPPPPSGMAQGDVQQPFTKSRVTGSPVTGSTEALILLRTMIAAASIDGVVDADERHAIVGALAEAGLSSDEGHFVEQELAAPYPIEELASQVTAPEFAEQVFAVAVLAITADTDAEKAFLERLQSLLCLNDAAVQRITASA